MNCGNLPSSCLSVCFVCWLVGLLVGDFVVRFSDRFRTVVNVFVCLSVCLSVCLFCLLVGWLVGDFVVLFSDRFRTVVNVFGDAVGAGIVAHLSRDDLPLADINYNEDSRPLHELLQERYTPRNPDVASSGV